jgi:hypothetical protein
MSRSLEEIQDKLVAPSRVWSEQGERCSRYRLASTTTAPTTNCSSLYSAATRRECCYSRPTTTETFSPHEGVTAPQAQYLFVILERIPDEPQHRRPQANEQGPALGVSPLLLIHCLGPYP